jgi:phosphomannomutase
VYWRGGSQIVAPLDGEIAAAAAAVPMTADLPLAPDAVGAAGPDLREAYVTACLSLVDADRTGRDALRIVYTPLHGVARELLLEVLARAGFDDVHVVAEQAEPDPDFPTVSFPNPEEPGALDLALALAAEVDADVVLANDPDGDRIAVAIPDGAGGWRPLSGDEIGTVVAEDLLARSSGPRAVATTVVSSQLLGRIAAHHGAAYAETLTGFKWLASAIAEAEADGHAPVLAYEQALGVMCGAAVRDKDGISAALVAADLAARRKAAGSSLAAALDELATAHGLHLTTGRSLRLEGPEGPALVEAVLSGLRADVPTEVGGVAVTAFEDRRAGVRTLADGMTERLATPPTDLLGLRLADGSRLQVRPSGTEPLLKFYVEVVEPVDGGDVAAARGRGQARLDALADAFLARATP